jgi:hypothetical protein
MLSLLCPCCNALTVSSVLCRRREKRREARRKEEEVEERIRRLWRPTSSFVQLQST